MMTSIKNFKTIATFFIKQNGINSNNPYKDICDNYGDFMNLLKNYDSKISGIDYMDIANKSILAQLEHGFNKGNDWNKEELYDHFHYVNGCMNYWKGVLIEKGGYKFD